MTAYKEMCLVPEDVGLSSEILANYDSVLDKAF